LRRALCARLETSQAEAGDCAARLSGLRRRVSG
jgi:hypothetical protein